MNNLKNFGSILYLARKFFLNVFYVGRKTYLNNTRTTVPRPLKSKKVMKRSFKNGLGSIPKKKKKLEIIIASSAINEALKENTDEKKLEI